jgi:antitoxin HicB
MNYTIIIQWSNEDNCFVVSLPEFRDIMQPVTHGETYQEALDNAQEVLELLIESYREEGKTLPQILKIQLIEQMNSNTTITAILEDATEKQPIATPKDRGWQEGFFEEVIGGWQGEPLVREPQSEYQEREPLL